MKERKERRKEKEQRRDTNIVKSCWVMRGTGWRK